VVQGKDEPIRLALVCLIAEGHLLIEDVPGVGKTTLAKALAASIDVSWHRIQFTPDLLPSDVTGVTVWNRGTGTFEFRAGGIFANVVLGDEINRASPKTQSALLEAMEERQVTVDSTTYRLDRPSWSSHAEPHRARGHVSVAREPARPLPHAHTHGYPARRAEIAILDSHGGALTAVDDLSPVASAADVRSMITLAQSVHVAPSLKGYIVDLAEPPGATAIWPSASRREPPSVCSGRRGPGPPPSDASTSSDDLKELASRCSNTAWPSPPRRRCAASPGATPWPTPSAA